MNDRAGSHGGAVAPSLAEPYRLWSLWDMLRFKAFDFVSVCFAVEKLQGDCLIDESAPDARLQEELWRISIDAALGYLQRYSEKMGLAASAGQAERIRAMASHGTEISPLCYLMRDLEKTVVLELKQPVFLQLERDLSKFYSEEDEPCFGDRVGTMFSKSTHDIAESRRCFAFERWDACAHHLMLAIEHAIRKWAKDLKLKTRAPLDLENLEQILQAADIKLKEIKQRKKSRKRDKDLKYLAETSGHFGFIKDAWRNHLAHGRDRYDQRKATNLMVHVEAFMRLLATRDDPLA